MDLILEIIFKIAQFISSKGETSEEEICNYLVSEGYDIEDIKDALSWIRTMELELLTGEEDDDRWRVFYDTKFFELLREKNIPRDRWELFLAALVSFYEETGVDKKELEEFAEIFSKIKGKYFIHPGSSRTN